MAQFVCLLFQHGKALPPPPPAQNTQRRLLMCRSDHESLQPRSTSDGKCETTKSSVGYSSTFVPVVTSTYFWPYCVLIYLYMCVCGFVLKSLCECNKLECVLVHFEAHIVVSLPADPSLSSLPPSPSLFLHFHPPSLAPSLNLFPKLHYTPFPSLSLSPSLPLPVRKK